MTRWIQVAVALAAGVVLFALSQRTPVTMGELQRIDGGATSDHAGPPTLAGLAPSERVVDLPPELSVEARDEDAGADEGSRAAATDARTAVLYGLVIDEVGTPVPNAGVWMYDEFRRMHRVDVDDEGRHSSVGLAAGRYELHAHGMRSRAPIIEVELEPGETQRLDVVLERAALIEIRCLTPDGRALGPALDEGGAWGARSKLQPIASLEPLPEFLPEPHAGGNNRIEAGAWWDQQLLGLEADYEAGDFGVLVLKEGPPAWISLALGQHVLRSVFVESAPVGDERLRIDFDVSVDEVLALRSTVRLRLVAAESGQPLEGQVTHRASNPIRSDAAGMVEVTGLWPGTVELQVSAEGRAPVTVPVVVRPAELQILPDVVLVRPVTIRGRVVGPEGEGLLVDVVAEPIERGAEPVRVRTGASGGFTFEGLVPGAYVVRISGDDELRFIHAPDTVWTSLGVRVDATRDDVDEVLVRAAPPTPVGVVFDRIAPPARITLEDAGGLVLRSRGLEADTPWNLKVAPGRYRLVARRQGEVLASRAIEVGAAPMQVRW